MDITLQFRNETKTCFRFEKRDENNNLMTLYLKKTDVREAGINPAKGIHIHIEEAK